MTPAEIAQRLREVAEQMTDIGAAMDYYGGFDGRMAQHGREMVGAANIAREWAAEIGAELKTPNANMTGLAPEKG